MAGVSTADLIAARRLLKEIEVEVPGHNNSRKMERVSGSSDAEGAERKKKAVLKKIVENPVIAPRMVSKLVVRRVTKG